MSITRAAFVVSTFFTLLFAASIAAIHAQPYDDNGLRDFLTPPDDCPMPCFMGIRPGMTTYAEAVAILEAHDWIRTVDTSRGRFRLIATWSGAQSAWIRETRELNLPFEDDVVQQVFVATHITLGDLWLALGSPEYLRRLESLDNLGSFSAAYPFGMMGFTVQGSCSVGAIWHSTIFINLNVERPPAGGTVGNEMLRDVVQRCHRLRAIISR